MVRLVDYNCANLLPSDHKPVYCIVEVACDRVRADSEQVVYNRLSSTLEKFRYGGPREGDSNDQITHTTQGCSFFPQLAVSTDLLCFDRCTYLSSCAQGLVLKNTGAVLSAWRFVSKADSSASSSGGSRGGDSAISRRWLSVHPTSGLLLPGETATVTVRVTVDALTAQRMSSGRGSLNDELILRNENGEETQVHVTASYLHSCYGMSLEALVEMHGPVRDVVSDCSSPYVRCAAVGNNAFESTGDRAEAKVAQEMDLLGLTDEPEVTSSFDMFSADMGTGTGTGAGVGTKAVAGVDSSLRAADAGDAAPVASDVVVAALAIVGAQPSLHPTVSPVAPAVTPAPMNVPKELWRLIDALRSEAAVQDASLFEQYTGFSGDGGYYDPLELAIVRESLSSGKQFPPGEVSAQALLVALGQFLYALPRPVVPYWLWPEASLAASRSEAQGEDGAEDRDRAAALNTPQMRAYCRRLLQQLPLLNYNTLVFVLSYLRFVLTHAASNRVSVQRLGTFCDSCLSGHAADKNKRCALRECFEYFLTCDASEFA